MSLRRIAARRRIHFIDRTDELDFASPVAMALRGYKSQEFLEAVDREAATRAFKCQVAHPGRCRP